MDIIKSHKGTRMILKGLILSFILACAFALPNIAQATGADTFSFEANAAPQIIAPATWEKWQGEWILEVKFFWGTQPVHEWVLQNDWHDREPVNVITTTGFSVDDLFLPDAGSRPGIIDSYLSLPSAGFVGVWSLGAWYHLEDGVMTFHVYHQKRTDLEATIKFYIDDLEGEPVGIIEKSNLVYMIAITEDCFDIDAYRPTIGFLQGVIVDCDGIPTEEDIYLDPVEENIIRILYERRSDLEARVTFHLGTPNAPALEEAKYFDRLYYGQEIEITPELLNYMRPEAGFGQGRAVATPWIVGDVEINEFRIYYPALEIADLEENGEKENGQEKENNEENGSNDNYKEIEEKESEEETRTPITGPKTGDFEYSGLN